MNNFHCSHLSPSLSWLKVTSAYPTPSRPHLCNSFLSKTLNSSWNSSGIFWVLQNSSLFPFRFPFFPFLSLFSSRLIFHWLLPFLHLLHCTESLVFVLHKNMHTTVSSEIPTKYCSPWYMVEIIILNCQKSSFPPES